MLLFVYHDVRDFLSCCFLVDTGGLFRAFFHATLRVTRNDPVRSSGMEPFRAFGRAGDDRAVDSPIEEVYFYFTRFFTSQLMVAFLFCFCYTCWG